VFKIFFICCFGDSGLLKLNSWTHAHGVYISPRLCYVVECRLDLHVPRTRMADVETRRLLHGIDTNDVMQQYLKQACSDLYEIIHLMSMNTCCHAVNTYHRTQPPGKTGANRTYKYQQTMQFLMNLGTTQNCTHPGSVRNADVCSVFAHGNTRERCALLTNMLCNDKRYCIMQWIFRHDEENKVASGSPNKTVPERERARERERERESERE